MPVDTNLKPYIEFKDVSKAFGDNVVLDRVSFYAPYKSDPERWARVVEGFKTAS